MDEPDWEQGKQLMQQVQRLTEEVSRKTESVADYLKLVEELGEPRSLWHPSRKVR